MLSDYHIHSRFSADSDENPEKIIQQALTLNMKEICFTDHQDFNWPLPNESFDIDTPSYFDTLLLLKDKYRSQINIKIGVELGLTCDNYQKNSLFIKENNFDYIIGSCHIVDQMDPYYSEFWENKIDKDIFKKYFSTLLNNLKLFHSIDTLGHLDYIVRYSPNKDNNYNPHDYFDVISEILQFIINKNIALEINTGCLAKGLPSPNPHTDILNLYRELGGKLVAVGSDAHICSNIGYGFDIAEELIDNYKFEILHL